MQTVDDEAHECLRQTQLTHGALEWLPLHRVVRLRDVVEDGVQLALRTTATPVPRVQHLVDALRAVAAEHEAALCRVEDGTPLEDGAEAVCE